LTSSFERIPIPSTLEGWEDLPVLGGAIEQILACESACPSPSLSVDEVIFHIHLYQASDIEPFEEFSNGSRVGDEEEVMAASICELPNRAMEGLWDSLIFSDNIKMKLLDYIHATLLLSDAGIDCTHILLFM
jgi:pachytene checkpoint protein 2